MLCFQFQGNKLSIFLSVIFPETPNSGGAPASPLTTALMSIDNKITNGLSFKLCKVRGKQKPCKSGLLSVTKGEENRIEL